MPRAELGQRVLSAPFDKPYFMGQFEQAEASLGREIRGAALDPGSKQAD